MFSSVSTSKLSKEAAKVPWERGRETRGRELEFWLLSLRGFRGLRKGFDKKRDGIGSCE